ncbi:hypothetical protein SNEBB_002650 [Seison nebaliae]|nr:hypothetical protein SNEBB_002650 [Seison nebaliae]
MFQVNTVISTIAIPKDMTQELKKSLNIIEIQHLSEEEKYEEIVKHKNSCLGILCSVNFKVTKELLGKLDQLKVVSTASVGIDHIDIGECQKLNIAVGNTPGILDDATANLTIALLLAVLRRIPEGINAVKSENGWKAAPDMFWLTGGSITGRTIGILGMGRIGKAICQRLVGFAPKKIIYTRSNSKHVVQSMYDLKSNYFNSLAIPIEQLGSNNDLFKYSDILIISCPLTDETRKLVNKKSLAMMKSTSVLINISRGGVIDQEALIEALKMRRIAAVGLDVCSPEPISPSHELVKLDNCVMLPHIGSAEVECRRAMIRKALDTIIQYV